MLLEIKSDYLNSQINVNDDFEDYDSMEPEGYMHEGKGGIKGGKGKMYKDSNEGMEMEAGYVQSNQSKKEEGPKTDAQFFEFLQKMLTEQEYKCLLKLIFLYSQCVITYNELI